MSSKAGKPVEAEVVEGNGLAVTFTPAAIDANFDALDARVEELIAGYAEARYDLTDADEIKQAKRDRTYLNGIAKEIDERRKAVKREYMRPLEDFEARANAIAAKVKKASANIKEQLDEAEERRKDALYAELERHYGEIAELLAPVVPYERIHDERWLNKTFGEVKAKEAMQAKVSKLADDWAALKEMEGMPHYADAERALFETLDLGEALAAARRAQAADDRIEEMKSAMAEPAPEPAPMPELAPMAMPEPAPMPEPVPAPVPAPEPPMVVPVPGEEHRPWVVVIPSATRSDMLGLAKILKMSDVTGEIKQGTLAQVYERMVRDGR